MRVLTLDPKRTHVNNPTCPMRLVHPPDKTHWVCLDCGCGIIMTSVEVMPVPEPVPRPPGSPLFTQEEIDNEREKMQQELGDDSAHPSNLSHKP